MQGVVVQGIRPPLPDPGRCPPKLRDLLTRSWHADPAQRPGATTLVEELDAIAFEVERSRPVAGAAGCMERVRQREDSEGAPSAPAYDVTGTSGESTSGVIGGDGPPRPLGCGVTLTGAMRSDGPSNVPPYDFTAMRSDGPSDVPPYDFTASASSVRSDLV